eukprot:TRINITY_DN2926_c0_g1_i10.p2 TRINITY_DN2926_c0_g1~~TRINITY_DN2926_c0_g1_i10.p2  ORF type:complete len:104 (+),score=47.56 TRINITY_DN2926_c0_g1_i10:815-1126(+)
MKIISSFLSQEGIVLEELNLSNNTLGDEGCVHLVEGLKKNKTVKNLNLHDCDITAEGMKIISSFLSQEGIVLEELNLINNTLGDEGCVHLVEGLKKNKTVKNH